jgi:hypothetical protein
MNGTRSHSARVILAVFALARFDRRGFDLLPVSPEAFLTSLAPLVAFPLTSAGLLLADGGGIAVISDFFATLAALLAAPVLSHALASAFGREALWLRYAIAFNWCQWVIPVAAGVLILLSQAAVTLGAEANLAMYGAFAALALYALWLHWFLVRKGLDLSPFRAGLVVVLVNLTSGALLFGPEIMAAFHH